MSLQKAKNKFYSYNNLSGIGQHISDYESELKNAGEYIKELEKAIPQWISVKDRLPEKDKEVLVTYGKYIYTGYLFKETEHEDTFTGKEFDIIGFMHSCENCEIEIMEPVFNLVTHWMPLPSPPIEKHGKEGVND